MALAGCQPVPRPFDDVRKSPTDLLKLSDTRGIMVLPVGQSDTVQHLIRVRKTADGLEYDELRAVRFVPLLEGLGKDG